MSMYFLILLLTRSRLGIFTVLYCTVLCCTACIRWVVQLSGGLPGCPWFFQAAAAASRCQHVNCTVYGDTKHLRHYWCHWATAKAFTTSRRRSSGTWNNLLPPSQGLPRRGFGLVRLEVRLCTSPTVWCWKSLFVDLPYLFLRYPAKYWRRIQCR